MDCCFCEEYHSPFNNQYYNQFGKTANMPSRILFETDNWYVVPTIGCLVTGYVLLVCKEHYLSLANLDHKLYAEMLETKKRVTETLEQKTKAGHIMFEHGVTSLYFTGANSVTHLHVHIVPCKNSIWHNISSVLKNRRTREFSDYLSLFDHWRHNRPQTYLIFEDVDGTIYYVPDASDLPSQFFRIQLANLLGQSEWDWRRECYLGNLIETYNMLSGSGVGNYK